MCIWRSERLQLDRGPRVIGTHVSVLPETGESECMHAWVCVSVCVIAREHQAGLEEAWEPGIRAAKNLRQTLGGPRGLTVGYWRKREVPATGGPLGCKGQLLVGL